MFFNVTGNKGNDSHEFSDEMGQNNFSGVHVLLLGTELYTAFSPLTAL